MLFRLNFLQTNVRFKVHGNSPFAKINAKYEERNIQRAITYNNALNIS